MTALREAAQQALEALELGYDAAKAEADQYHAAMAGYRPERHARMDAEVQQIAAAITALKAALAEPQEPVAWGMRHSDGRIYDCIAPGEHDREPGRYTVPLYTHPAPQRQPLTQYEAWEIWYALADRGKKGEDIVHAFARAIERAHGIGGQDEVQS